MSLFKAKPVKKVEQMLRDAGVAKEAIRVAWFCAKDLAATAEALGASTGALIQSEIYMIGEQPVVVLRSAEGDCHPESLPRIFNLAGEARACNAEESVRVGGFEFGSLPPLAAAWPQSMPVAIDAGLKRHPTLFAPAGHPDWFLELSVDEIKILTEGIVSYAVAGQPDAAGHQARAAKAL